jgi:serine/threonine-protein kinase
MAAADFAAPASKGGSCRLRDTLGEMASVPTLPRMLGRYALYERIASGGMASVHIGRLVGPVGFARTVAIKRMHPQFAEDPEFVSMFLDEARLAARIRHPNVVPTLDVVATDGELFLVMDFVQGESLARLIRASTHRGELIPPAMAATIMAGVLHGLHAAHEAKNERGERLEIVHRDVSPHNVLVGVDGVSRVLDFGVAKAVGRLQTTREGQLKGKLAYMAPEQLRGSVTRATDVYAASVVLWEALTCQRLFQGENEGHIFDQVLKGREEPPSKYAPGIPPALDEATMRGLLVDPTKRYATAREMACALEEAIAPAAASKIGDWVERSAKETLDQRSARIASIESDSSLQAPPSPAWGAALGSQPSLDAHLAARASRPVIDEIPVEIPEDVARTQLSSGSISGPVRLSRPDRQRPAWLAAGGGGLVALGVVVALARSSHGPAAAAPAVSAEPPPTVVPTAVAPAAPATGSLPASEAAPQPAPASSSATTSNAPMRPVPTMTPTPASRPAPGPAPRAKPNCNPNYTYDAEGNKIFKLECLGH